MPDSSKKKSKFSSFSMRTWQEKRDGDSIMLTTTLATM